jgi:hypothetical protein
MTARGAVDERVSIMLTPSYDGVVAVIIKFRCTLIPLIHTVLTELVNHVLKLRRMPCGL